MLESVVGSACFSWWQLSALALLATHWKSNTVQLSKSIAKTHWTTADMIKTQTNPNDNLTYGLFISRFARSTQIGLMYHHNPHNTEFKLQQKIITCKCACVCVQSCHTLISTNRVAFVLASFVQSERSSRQPVPNLLQMDYV